MKIKKINEEFILETEMIPVIIKGISNKLGVKYYIQEFETGNGIPDIVFAKEIRHKFHRKMDYESLHIISKILSEEEIIFDSTVVDYGKYKELKDYLIRNKYIEILNDGSFVRKKIFKPLINEIIAVEAKLSDWKNGLYQALRYKYFANESYLALSKSKIKNVDQKLFKNKGIGLISVDTNDIEIIVNAKKQNPINVTSFLYSSQKFYEEISMSQS